MRLNLGERFKYERSRRNESAHDNYYSKYLSSWVLQRGSTYHILPQSYMFTPELPSWKGTCLLVLTVNL